MDNELIRNGRLTFLIDSTWREDIMNLPREDIFVPNIYLPDPEPDNGNITNETLKELDFKWIDLALTSIANDSTLN